VTTVGVASSTGPISVVVVDNVSIYHAGISGNNLINNNTNIHFQKVM
jgi:hypothetical protein